ncbi:MAG: sugar transferase [Thermodesulfobacteriota bacterium]
MTLKRLVDVVLSTIGIIVASPIMILIAVIIKLESRGPVLYGCTRVGLNGTLFKMLKFRTMVDSADKIDCKLCCDYDVRVTSFGKLLRRTKLNELPQFFNVLFGDMSVVGPRPEDPKFINFYGDKWKVVLSLKPGIVGPNQISNRNEEDLFPDGENPEQFYIHQILPEKLDRDMDYVTNQSLIGDLKILTRGVLVTLFKGRIKSLFASGWVSGLGLLRDLALSVFAYFAAYAIRFESFPLAHDFMYNAAIILLINGCLFPILGLYKRNTRFFSLPDLFFLTKLIVLVGALFIVANRLAVPQSTHSRAIFFLYPVILLALMGGARILERIGQEQKEQKNPEEKTVTKTVVYGAGRLGVETARQLQFEPDVRLVGFVDDDPKLKDASVLGLKVLGRGVDLPMLRELYEIDRIVIAFRPSSNGRLDAARKRCIDGGIAEVLVTSVTPPPCEFPPVYQSKLRSLRLSDEIGMTQIPLLESSGDSVDGSAVAIIGGGDGVAEHLCRELHRLGTEKIIIVDNCPARLRQIRDRLTLHRRPVKGIETVYHPWGFHEQTRRILEPHKVKWIICHHLNRSASSSSLNDPAYSVADFIELARFMRMASSLSCEGFTLVSPALANSFSQEEISVHHLCEQYVADMSEEKSIGLRSGIVRIPNILEDEEGILLRACRTMVLNPFAFIPEEPMAFSSARYIARTILNCFPLQDCGETYVQFPAMVFTLKALVEFHRNGFSRNERANGSNHCDIRADSGVVSLESQNCGRAVRTPVEHVRMIVDPERSPLVRWEKKINFFEPYLNRSERAQILGYCEELRARAFIAEALSTINDRAVEQLVLTGQ